MRKKVIITGASRGIGEETAYLLAAKGYDLCLVGRDEEKLNKVKNRIMTLNNSISDSSLRESDIIVRACDVSVIESVEGLKNSLTDWGCPYAIINNAGISYIGLLTQMSYEDWKRIMDTDLNALFYMSRAFLPSMLQKKEGRIINISSVWGNIGASMEVAYSAAKGGVNSFTRALAKELAPSNISVNAIAFGVIDTDMNSCFSKEDMENLKEEIPMDRIGSSGEAAQMILSVLESPSYLTGQVITMDGGWT